MEPLQPMRPVEVPHDERESAPRWKMWIARAVLAALCLTAVLVDEGQSQLIPAGVCASAIGAALVIASTRRTMARTRAAAFRYSAARRSHPDKSTYGTRLEHR